MVRSCAEGLFLEVRKFGAHESATDARHLHVLAGPNTGEASKARCRVTITMSACIHSTLHILMIIVVV